jgi:hypothetical protein
MLMHVVKSIIIKIKGQNSDLSITCQYDMIERKIPRRITTFYTPEKKEYNLMNLAVRVPLLGISCPLCIT